MTAPTRGDLTILAHLAQQADPQTWRTITRMNPGALARLTGAGMLDRHPNGAMTLTVTGKAAITELERQNRVRTADLERHARGESRQHHGI